ncbi:hypothetical protein Huta_1705 [Halorhabdus utahensis DSM 12940]|uniref:Uncharacterized protein n=1 Tax=Halorhabdus utahensis (strain DSM 12940 / JCM 11049 / AX-2) TaxID=519442 RepID=C7NQX4_HALUD|nr:hypothetical protein Huta_1705 [Halorhabdus utahensis DSM 12940]
MDSLIEFSRKVWVEMSVFDPTVDEIVEYCLLGWASRRSENDSWFHLA